MKTPGFSCVVNQGDRERAWIWLRGELDLAGTPALRRALGDAQDSAHLVVLDLRALSFMDAGGLHAILDADASARSRGRRLILVRGSAQVDRLRTLVGVTDRLEIVDLPLRGHDGGLQPELFERIPDDRQG